MIADTTRRAALFERTCLGVASVLPLFYAAGYYQGGERATLTYVAATGWLAASLAAHQLSRRGHLTAGVHLLTGSFISLIVIGCFVSGRIGPAIWLTLAAIALGNFHDDPRQIRWLTLGGAASCLLVWATLPAMDPLQMPVAVILVTLLGVITYYRAKVTQLDLADTRAVNARLALSNAALGEARARAEAANQAKTVFLTTMSHELRTPLNAVIGYAEMLRQDAEDATLDPADAAADLARIEAAGRQLLGLVSRVLDLSNLESGKFTAVESSFSLQPFLQDTLAPVRDAARSAGLALMLDADDEPLTVRVDRDRTSLILVNLLTNALQFTPAGSVTLRARRDGDDLHLAVIDTGIGVAPEDQVRIFEVFTQIDASFTRKVDGAGLGLALCARFAERLGAKLTVASVVGQGTTFTLSLPGAIEHAPPSSV